VSPAETTAWKIGQTSSNSPASISRMSSGGISVPMPMNHAPDGA
jgi:hypothetical protein